MLKEVSFSVMFFYFCFCSETISLSRIPPNGNTNGILMAISFRIFYFHNSGKFLSSYSLDSYPLLPPVTPTSFPKLDHTMSVTPPFQLPVTGTEVGPAHCAGRIRWLGPLHGTGLAYVFHPPGHCSTVLCTSRNENTLAQIVV